MIGSKPKRLLRPPAPSPAACRTDGASAPRPSWGYLMAIDFLIVGGGIGGAVLAHLLGRAGKRVLVLEKGRAPAPQNRPEILWPATVEVLRGLIPADLERRWMLPVRGGLVTCGRRVLLRIGPE